MRNREKTIKQIETVEAMIEEAHDEYERLESRIYSLTDELEELQDQLNADPS